MKFTSRRYRVHEFVLDQGKGVILHNTLLGITQVLKIFLGCLGARIVYALASYYDPCNDVIDIWWMTFQFLLPNNYEPKLISQKKTLQQIQATYDGIYPAEDDDNKEVDDNCKNQIVNRFIDRYF